MRYFLSKAKDLSKYWQAYKITLRRGYYIADIALWCDYVDMLGRLGKDRHNAHFVCPQNLQESHDRIQRKLLSQRDTGKIPFSMVGHKCYYKESDITEALNAQTE